MSKMLKGIGRHLGVDKENIYVQDYKEGFCHYMFYQPKELWQYESAMFFCDGQTIRGVYAPEDECGKWSEPRHVCDGR